jgi:CheY-like chemotaxis protein
MVRNRNEDSDRISGLRLGADDYLTKTVSGNDSGSSRAAIGRPSDDQSRETVPVHFETSHPVDSPAIGLTGSLAAIRRISEIMEHIMAQLNKNSFQRGSAWRG